MLCLRIAPWSDFCSPRRRAKLVGVPDLLRGITYGPIRLSGLYVFPVFRPSGLFRHGYNSSNLNPLPKIMVEVWPCCDCDTTSPGNSPTQPPCSSFPARLTSRFNVILGDSKYWHVGLNTTDIFGDVPDNMMPYFRDTSSSHLTNIFHNVFQLLNHLVHMELGIITENQIYSSPTMFNATISDVYLGPPWGLAASASHHSTSNKTLMAEWAKMVGDFNNTDCVPVINYLCSVPCLKPLGAAITSVFVSTFSMLSALWTVFSLVAGTLAKIHKGCYSPSHGASESRSYSIAGSEDESTIMEDASDYGFIPPQKNPVVLWNTPFNDLKLEVTNNNIAMAQMRLSLARIELSLKKRWPLEEEDAGDRMELLYHSTVNRKNRHDTKNLKRHTWEAQVYEHRQAAARHMGLLSKLVPMIPVFMTMDEGQNWISALFISLVCNIGIEFLIHRPTGPNSIATWNGLSKISGSKRENVAHLEEKCSDVMNFEMPGSPHFDQMRQYDTPEIRCDTPWPFSAHRSKVRHTKFNTPGRLMQKRKPLRVSHGFARNQASLATPYKSWGSRSTDTPIPAVEVWTHTLDILLDLPLLSPHIETLSVLGVLRRYAEQWPVEGRLLYGSVVEGGREHFQRGRRRGGWWEKERGGTNMWQFASINDSRAHSRHTAHCGEECRTFQCVKSEVCRAAASGTSSRLVN
ncbi:hypothetical protein B0H14DRAFT_2589482 [Mycena olivaceomarginata]|nr:hypothetical protein B0H14DRAFT_2589482 [Mycena olivaceomarginata]